MLNHLEQLMMEAREQEQLARVYELKALSSQINPHFLYNTLDTIIWMAEFQDTNRVVSITKALATYFRLALNGGEDLIPLTKEVDHVRQYLYIQQQRYEEKLSYEIQVDENIPDILLPKLVLQPLVENAIYHGIKEINRPGKIQLTVRYQSPSIKITIEDNGVGLKKQGTSNKALGGVGIQNVKERLALYFGEEFKMEFDSVENSYTKVYLTIPISN